MIIGFITRALNNHKSCFSWICHHVIQRIWKDSRTIICEIEGFEQCWLIWFSARKGNVKIIHHSERVSHFNVTIASIGISPFARPGDVDNWSLNTWKDADAFERMQAFHKCLSKLAVKGSAKLWPALFTAFHWNCMNISQKWAHTNRTIFQCYTVECAGLFPFHISYCCSDERISHSIYSYYLKSDAFDRYYCL